jgi:hypothetical protein
MTSFLSRYKAGEHEKVWAELLAFGAGIRNEPLLREADAVARETMLRVRSNVELLVQRLHSRGYKFGVYPDGSQPAYHPGPHVPPVADTGDRITVLEGLIGTIPLSLRVFWEIVGSVDFIGYHPEWPEYSDPLVVFPIEGTEAEYEDWKEACEEYGRKEVGDFGIPIAPDVYHKDNVSGGPPYSIKVPNSAIDAKLEDERNETTFVDYLRVCFRCGGFPGKGPLPLELSELRKGLLPI